MYVCLVAFLVANSAYVFARVATIALSVIVFLYGLRKQEFNFDYTTGNYNIPAVQFSAVSIISFFQGYLLYLFVKKQVKLARENAAVVVVKTKPKQKTKKREGAVECFLANFNISIGYSLVYDYYICFFNNNFNAQQCVYYCSMSCSGKKSALLEDDDLPEVDQATKKNLRNRSSAKVK